MRLVSKAKGGGKACRTVSWSTCLGCLETAVPFLWAGTFWEKAKCERRKSQIFNFIWKRIVKAVAALEGASTSASYQDVLACFGLGVRCDN